MTSILSENIFIDASVQEIEQELIRRYGSIIRWAIVDIVNNKYKISVSFEK